MAEPMLRFVGKVLPDKRIRYEDFKARLGDYVTAVQLGNSGLTAYQLCEKPQPDGSVLVEIVCEAPDKETLEKFRHNHMFWWTGLFAPVWQDKEVWHLSANEARLVFAWP
jgi:hypothetical protein